MQKKLLLGNEAIGLGAVYAGVNVVTGYPGTPSTEVLETVAKHNPGDIYVEWSVNEKVAMEVAAGASYAGARVMVTMKQVGLNVASDPLMSLAYIGVKGGMIVLVADDPGPFSSQTEQDTRHYARFSNLPVFDPSSPEEAFSMVKEAFELSEKTGLPVFLRRTTRICHSCSTVEIPDERETHAIDGFVKDPQWVILPTLSYKKHIHLEKLQAELGDILSESGFNSVTGKGRRGIAASGVTYSYVKEVLAHTAADVKLFKVGTPYPLPVRLAEEFMDGLDEILVIEELDPVIEEGLIELSVKSSSRPVVKGKKSGHLPFAGEYGFELANSAISGFLGTDINVPAGGPETPSLPVRPPVLCAGCPHRGAFYAVKRAMKGKKAFFTGDIGCYTLGNAKPLDMVDTCLCMGAGITIAQGLKRAEDDAKHIAFIGDSTFFHTGIPGIINAVYNKTDITVMILDNSTTAMTGHQPHPGTGKTMMGEDSGRVDIENLLKACGVGYVAKADPFKHRESVETVRKAVDFKGPSAVIFEAPCISLVKPGPVQAVAPDRCTNCKRCIREIGCPAISSTDDGVVIDPSLCYGCTLCSQVCAAGAIGGADI